MKSGLRRVFVLLLVLICVTSCNGCIYFLDEMLDAADGMLSVPDGDNSGTDDSEKNSSDGSEQPEANEPTVYGVSSDHFTYLSYEKDSERKLYVKGRSLDPVFNISYQIVTFDSDGRVLSIYEGANNVELGVCEDFEIGIVVSENVYGAVSYVWAIFSGKSYKEPTVLTEYRIDLVSGGKLYNSTKVEINGKAELPEAPEKKYHVFDGWYTDPLLTEPYDAEADVTEPLLTLYASFSFDEESFRADVGAEVLPGIMTVYCKSYNTKKFFGIEYETESVTSQGSGVIFHMQDGWCYVLTNWHVAELESGYSHRSIEVKDSLGNIYKAQVYENPTKDYGEAIDKSYDLAVLCFKGLSLNLKTVAFSDEELTVGDYVSAVGSPKNAANTVSVGEILGYSNVGSGSGELEAVKFKVLKFDAYINNGSSGGALVDTELKLVGIVFAGNVDGEFEYGLAIPTEKVKEFLEIYVYDGK